MGTPVLVTARVWLESFGSGSPTVTTPRKEPYSRGATCKSARAAGPQTAVATNAVPQWEAGSGVPVQGPAGALLKPSATPVTAYRPCSSVLDLLAYEKSRPTTTSTIGRPVPTSVTVPS